MNTLGVECRSLATAWCAALFALLSACATPPKPEVQHAAIADSALGLTGAAAAAADDSWWQGFGDAQLDRLIEQALSDNPGLAQASARLQLAEAQEAAARAGRQSELKLSGGETRLKIPQGFPQAIAGGQTVWLGDLGVAASWDLDLWGLRRDQVRETRALTEAASVDVDQARLLLAGALVQSYIDLYRSYALADIAERTEAQRSNILDITRRRVAAGLDTRVELREAEGALPQARVALTQAQSAQALAVHQLTALTGRGADAYAAVARPQLQLDAALPLPGELPVNLLARRPDVIAARSRIEAADAGKRAAKAAFYPDISLKALAGFASFSLTDLISARSLGYGAGPGVSLPLFDGGRLRAQYRGTEAVLDQAVADYDDTVLRAVHQAADQLSLIESLSSELGQQRQSLDAAEEAYRLAEERYRAGLAGYLTVLNAETEVLSERRQQVDLSASLAVARVSLLLAVGGSFQSPASQSVAAR
jgi:NodT family efflux transporter outer membrane factor (OMF) lipoprotein